MARTRTSSRAAASASSGRAAAAITSAVRGLTRSRAASSSAVCVCDDERASVEPVGREIGQREQALLLDRLDENADLPRREAGPGRSTRGAGVVHAFRGEGHHRHHDGGQRNQQQQAELLPDPEPTEHRLAPVTAS